MTCVIAALDNSAAAAPVLATARTLGLLLEAEVLALHVRVDGDAVARGVAGDAGLGLAVTAGPVDDELAEAASARDVVLVVLGARARPGGAAPAGHTALALATALAKPVVLVPPDTRFPGRLRRVLVPLEGSVSTSLAPRQVIELGLDAGLEVVILHVHDPRSIPAFTDQPQHEADAWASEFLARYCPRGTDSVRLETRIGRPEDLVPELAEELDADLLALGWSQELAAGRAPVVRAALERARIPVLLVPVVRAASPGGLLHASAA